MRPQAVIVPRPLRYPRNNIPTVRPLQYSTYASFPNRMYHNAHDRPRARLDAYVVSYTHAHDDLVVAPQPHNARGHDGVQRVGH